MNKILGKISLLAVFKNKLVATGIMTLVILPMYLIGFSVWIGFLQIVTGIFVYCMVMYLLKDEIFLFAISQIQNLRKKH